MVIGNFIGVCSNIFGNQNPSNPIADAHIARVLADGGIIDSEILLRNTIRTQVLMYGITSEAEYKSKVIAGAHAAVFGYKVGVGSAITLGQACSKLYSVNENADVIQATVASQPLLLRYNGSQKYYFNPRVSNNLCRTTNSQVTAYNSATDTLRGTFRIFLNNQTTATTDFLGSMGSAANFVIINKGASMSIRFRGTANAVDSSNFVKPATPAWVRYTINTTQVVYEWSSDNVATPDEVTNWTAIGTQARPTVGTVSATMTICDTAGTPINATSIYYALMENLTTGAQCTFDPNLYNRTAGETQWIGTNCTWSVLSSSGVTGLKSIMVDETTVVYDGVAYKLANASLAISQPYTVYVSRKRLGTGVVYGLAASSQLSNDGVNSTINNGNALSIANASTAKQLITIVVDGATSAIQVDNGAETIGNSGSNNGIYLEIGGNGASYGNFVVNSLYIIND